ncbi:trypsin-like peptidase domain-containing protein [Bacteroides thetaiotaomicron]|jgi:peptidase S7, flavivirus NS3 serine protease|nr:trypsin-like peptidase domain-containing protein [Bacteroides thetaiotaomicron]MBL3928605.1 trypsin-like peptidase domain-containing protein [Bacteroides thetaiotaomicron]MBL3952702.1 trypsin-like peptidase domain-containing protein [Bacteroides thetaiotaomicron]
MGYYTKSKNKNCMRNINRTTIYLKNRRLFFKVLSFVILFLVCTQLAGCHRKPASRAITGTSGYVDEIIDGKTIKLTNELKVNLIGVIPSELTKRFLEDNLIDAEVTLIADSNDPIQNYSAGTKESINAYVIVKDDELLNCVNGRMVRIGIAQSDASVTIDSVFRPMDKNQENNILSRSELLAKLNPATFTIVTSTGQGTGFYINSKGVALTNAHVLNDANDQDARVYSFTRDGKYDVNNYRTIERVILFGDASECATDFTIFEVSLNGYETSFIPLATQKERDGNPVLKLGCTLGEPAHFADGLISRTTDGTITHSININHGDSGSPLINERGQVIGINRGGRVDPDHGTATSVNYAVDIQIIRSWLDNHPDNKEGVLYGR